MPRWFGLCPPRREQRRGDLVRLHGFDEMVNGTDCCSDIAVAHLNSRARVRTFFHQRPDDAKAAPGGKTRINHSYFWRIQLDLIDSFDHRPAAMGLNRAPVTTRRGTRFSAQKRNERDFAERPFSCLTLY
jgi:hypothetical protein